MDFSVYSKTTLLVTRGEESVAFRSPNADREATDVLTALAPSPHVDSFVENYKLDDNDGNDDGNEENEQENSAFFTLRDLEIWYEHDRTANAHDEASNVSKAVLENKLRKIF